MGALSIVDISPCSWTILNKDEVRESSSLPDLAVLPMLATLPDLRLLERGDEFVLGTAERLGLGIINLLGAILKLDPVKLFALRISLAVTLYLRHIQRRESSGYVLMKGDDISDKGIFEIIVHI